MFLATVIGGTATITFYFYNQAFLLFEKGVGLFLKVSDTFSNFSYRSIDFLFRSLSEFPLGIGFGVSNRHLPDDSITDNGIYAIISQLSLLSFVFIFVFLCYWHFLIRSFVKNKKELANKRYAPQALIMVLAMPLIFFFDIVWLYPGYILPFLILSTYMNNPKERPQTTKINFVK